MGRIGTELLRAAMRRGLKDGPAGAVFGVNQSTFTKWKNGVVIPESSRADELAEFIGVERRDVLEWLADDRSARSRSRAPTIAPTSEPAEDGASEVADEATLTQRLVAIEDDVQALRTELAGLRDDVAELLQLRSARGQGASGQRQPAAQP